MRQGEAQIPMGVRGKIVWRVLTFCLIPGLSRSDYRARQVGPAGWSPMLRGDLNSPGEEAPQK